MKADAKALTDNGNAVKDAQTKINSLISRKVKESTEFFRTTCSAVINNVRLLSTLMTENPKNTRIKVLNVETLNLIEDLGSDRFST